MDSLSNNNGHRTSHYIAGAALVAGVAFLLSRRTPATPVKLEWKWDRKTDYSGLLIAEVLHAHGVRFLYTLCGGHISPILTGCEKKGIRVIDVRHEVNAAFAADATSRLTGVPGVCAVTAGPGVTNVITAVKNAQCAQSPLIILGGATSDLLKGRHSLQDIDQFALLRPCCKWMKHVARIIDVVPALEEAFYIASSGTPGPVFLEFPVDVLYQEDIDREEFNKMIGRGKDYVSRLLRYSLNKIVDGMFVGVDNPIPIHEPRPPSYPMHSHRQVNSTLAALQRSKKPMLLLGSQVMLQVHKLDKLVAAVTKLGIPTWLQGMCRGLLGTSDQYIRTARKEAFRETDCIIICGVPFDFRTQYGLGIPVGTFVASINRDSTDLYLNRDLKFFMSPTIPVLGDPCDFLLELAEKVKVNPQQWLPWKQQLNNLERTAEEKQAKMASTSSEFINPVKLCLLVDKYIDEDSILIGDGGDFVATMSYAVRPRKPLTWLDPGVFGTLGIGGGFALAAKLVRPKSEVWLFWGDGASGFSLVELDSFRRHKTPVIALIGNDACWTQIHRGQVKNLGSDAGCVLEHSAYEQVAQALGAVGIFIDKDDQIEAALIQAKEFCAKGHSVVINAKISKSDFREGSLAI